MIRREPSRERQGKGTRRIESMNKEERGNTGTGTCFVEKEIELCGVQKSQTVG